MADRSVSVRLEAEIADYLAKMARASKATDKFAQKTERNVGRSSKVAVAALGGINAAAAGASVGVAAALGGASAAFIGLGAVALRNNAEVTASFRELSHEVSTGITQDAAPMEEAFVSAANKMRGAYQALRPEMRDAFAASAPHVETLTDGVIGFAQNAMPGMVTSIERAGPVMEGMRSLMIDTGAGVGDFFEIISRGSEDAGEGIEHFGTLVRGVLPETATLLNDLSSLWAEHGDEVVDVVTRIVGVLGDLTGSALPLVSTATGTALDVLDSILQVIEPMADVLGPVIGAWLSLAAGMKAIRGVQGIIGGVTGRVTELGQAVTKAERRAQMFKAAGLAIGLAADTMIRKMTALNPQVEALDEGLEKWVKTGRAAGETARVFGKNMEHVALGIEQVNAGGLAKFIAGLTEGLPLVGSALQGLDSSFARGSERIKALDTALANMVSSGNIEGAQASIRKIAQQTGMSLDEIRKALPQFNAAVEQYKQRITELGTQGMQSRPGIEELETALEALKTETTSTKDAVEALNTAWKNLHGVQLTVREATAAWEGGLDDIRESIKGLKEDTTNWQAGLINARGQIDLTTEAGRTLHGQLVTQGEEYRRVAATALKSAQKRNASEAEAAAAVRNAVSQRRNQFISEMRQMGFNQTQARRLANEYLGMPRDIYTRLHLQGAAYAQSQIEQTRRQMARLDGASATMRVGVSLNSAIGGLNIPHAFGGPAGYADGGSVQGFPTGGGVSGPGGPRDDLIPALLSAGEHVWTAREVDAAGGHRAVMELRRAVLRGGMADGGAVVGAPAASSVGRNGGTVLVRVDFRGMSDEFARAMRHMVRVEGGGDVQLAFGRN